MRSDFDEQLLHLSREMVRMGMLCEQVISEASEALLKRDAGRARRVQELLPGINRKEREIENLCFCLILRQQPVAKDLRVVSAALKMVTDMERIADQSGDIAEIVSMGAVTQRDFALPFRAMAEHVIQMVNESVDAFVKADPEMAQAVIDRDDAVDADFSRIKTMLAKEMKRSDVNGEAVLDFLMIAKYFERIGDHAVNVAAWVLFSITGNHERVG
jgi:hypothetical protein